MSVQMPPDMFDDLLNDRVIYTNRLQEISETIQAIAVSTKWA